MLDRNIHRLYGLAVFPTMFTQWRSSLFQPIYYKDARMLLLMHCVVISGSLPERSSFNIVGPDIISLKNICQLIKNLQGSNSFSLSVPIQPLYLFVVFLYFLSFRRFFLRPEQILRMREDKVFPSDWSVLDPLFTPTPAHIGLKELHEQY